MADEAPPPSPEATPAPAAPLPSTSRNWGRTAGRSLAGLFLGIVALIGIGLFVLDTSIGHRFVVDRIAELAPKSGLRVEIGRIEGSVYGEAVLRDVSLADPQGVFARVPVAELDWRPLSWLRSGLDVRKLVLRRGTLLRMPKMNPGDPDAPFLPGFDIRIDDLRVIDMTVAEGIAGPQRRIQLAGKIDIRDGRATVRADARLGGNERLFALLDAEPDGDRFDLKLDYAAPKGGLLAQLAGMDTSLAIKIDGSGTWSKWNGVLSAQQDGKRLAALQLGNRAGRYSVLGKVYPDGLVPGLPPRLAGQAVSLDARGTFERRVWDGRIVAATPSLGVVGNGAVDFGNNAFREFDLGVAVVDPELIQGTRIENGRLAARLDGGFRDLAIDHWVSASGIVTGGIRLVNVAQSGTITRNEDQWALPLNLSVARIVTGDPVTDKRLVNARASGTIRLTGSRLDSDYLALAMPGLTARLVLTGDTSRGGYGLAGGAGARGFPLPNLGTINGDAKLVASFGSAGWTLRTNLAGRMVKVENDTLTTVAGTGIRFSGAVAMGSNRPILIERAKLDASKLTLTISGRRLANGLTTISGGGRHVEYGPFTVEASLSGEGPRAVLVFADPLPAAGLKNVRVALSPIAKGFRIETSGGSTLGPFDGVLGFFSPPGGPTRIEIDRLNVSETSVTGALTLGGGAASGSLALAGGGVSGTVRLAPREGGQGFDAMLTANNAKFGGEAPLTIAKGTLQASGFFASGRSSITGTLDAQGVGKGDIYFATLGAQANVVDGSGRATAQLTGRRGSRFNLQLGADIAPRRIAVLAKGDFAGQRIVMRRRAVLTSENGGWRLAPTQLGFGGGTAIVSGSFGGSQTALDLALFKMPLSIGNLFVSDLGLGGTASGLIEYRQAGRGVPTGNARLQLNGLSRSGLVLTSRPIDLAMVADLSANALQTRMVMREGGQSRGRVQARISDLPAGGGLADRLRAGRLFAQLRYNGPADALWRLAAIDAFDLSGPFALAADVTGTIVDPQIRGSMSSKTLRLQSALTGTNVSNIAARGTFDGSRLVISNFSGTTAGDGRVTGSGMFDLSDLGRKGLGIDLRIAANKARVLARADMGATVTGPLRIVSDGATGTIAGRVSIDTARWKLGVGAAAEQLPDIRTREINGMDRGAARPAVRTVWRYLIDAQADNRINVRGMGLDSEWSGGIRLRGTTDAMAITGRVDLVRGAYEFAGKRFELTRGRINFDGGSPPNPRLDVVAELDQDDLDARVNIGGTALRPEITFSSTPALPEDELLSRLLFGNSITDISAPEALQLGAALASLRGGGGMDPINQLRSAIGLDRLRIVSADPARDRGTGIAAGKYFGRRFYAEIITDGKGYSATQVEFRITSWLSILAAVSSVGHQNINVKASKDY